MRQLVSISILTAGIILLVFMLPVLLATPKHPVVAASGPGIAPDRLSFIQAGSTTPTQTVTTTPTQTGTITPTLTITATLSITATQSPSASPGITPTAPNATQPTASIASEVPTLVSTQPTELQISGTISPTATLIPFPTISMVFPTGSESATITPTDPQENGSGAESLRLWLIVGLLLLWSLIIAWFWLVQRRG